MAGNHYVYLCPIDPEIGVFIEKFEDCVVIDQWLCRHSGPEYSEGCAETATFLHRGSIRRGSNWVPKPRLFSEEAGETLGEPARGAGEPACSKIIQLGERERCELCSRRI